MTQDEYIDILFNDLTFNLTQRRVKLLEDYGVESLDDLPRVKKSELIDELKEMKSRRTSSNQDYIDF